VSVTLLFNRVKQR